MCLTDRRCNIRIQILLLILTMSASFVMAQFPTTNPDTREYGNQLGFGNQLDSLENDSLLEDIEIKPDVRTVNPQELYSNRAYITPHVYNFAQTHYWNELDMVDGFIYSLGQIGKPYAAYSYGLSDRFDPTLPYWRNPIFERYNVYIFNGQYQIPYYDTKTPYVNAKYAQASRGMQRVDVTVSRNIIDRWNVSFLYQGRQSQGAYLQFNTNHTNLFASTYYTTKNKKYHLFGNWSYNELDDDLFGGVVRPSSSFSSGDASEILMDDGESIGEFFDKDEENLISSAGNLKKFVRQVTVDQYYHLIKPPDSIQAPHTLTVRGLVHAEWADHHFDDPQINISKLSQHAIPVYPTRDTSFSKIDESFKSSYLNVLGGVSYILDTELDIRTQGSIAYSSTSLVQDTLNEQTLTRFDIQGEATISLKWGEAHAGFHQRVSNLYNPQNLLEAGVKFFPFNYEKKDDRVAINEREWEIDSEDSTRAYRYNSPLVLSMNYRKWGQNPSLFQTHYQPREGNAYQPQSDLKNQQFNQWIGRAEWQHQSLIRNGDTLLPTFYFAEIFASRVGNMIYYDQQMNVLQADDNTSLSWFGVRMGGRTRMFDKFYLESEVTLQRGTTNAEDDFAFYAENLPQLWGRSSFYYDNRNISIAAILRIGIEITYFTNYMGFTMDMTSQEFFPTPYEVSGYPRADAFFATQVKGADIFFKFTHVNEGLLRGGYYTTPFYPMLESTFSLGINWSFYN